jgi:transcriptional regulator GlxA family with amidase domain
MQYARFLVLPNIHLLDLAGPLQIITTLNELGIAQIDVQCIGPLGEIQTFQQPLIGGIQPLPAQLPDNTMLFVTGSKLGEETLLSDAWQRSAAWLRAVASRLPARLNICGVCTGAFLLGAAGLLDGRTCTTHYRFIDRLAKDFPKARVVDNRVYVRERGIWTSAGITAGIDMTLHLISHHFGDEVAVRVAQENVAWFRHFSDDPPLGASLRYRSHANVLVHTVQNRISSRLSEPSGYAQLAQEMGYSIRHLARLFERETGTTIKRYQMKMRLDLARRLLTRSAFSIESIALRCGFQSVQAFRANWDKYESQPPSALRAATTLVTQAGIARDTIDAKPASHMAQHRRLKASMR